MSELTNYIKERIKQLESLMDGEYKEFDHSCHTKIIELQAVLSKIEELWK